jgi:hypothetical protein
VGLFVVQVIASVLRRCCPPLVLPMTPSFPVLTKLV